MTLKDAIKKFEAAKPDDNKTKKPEFSEQDVKRLLAMLREKADVQTDAELSKYTLTGFGKEFVTANDFFIATCK